MTELTHGIFAVLAGVAVAVLILAGLVGLTVAFHSVHRPDHQYSVMARSEVQLNNAMIRNLDADTQYANALTAQVLQCVRVPAACQ